MSEHYFDNPMKVCNTTDTSNTVALQTDIDDHSPAAVESMNISRTNTDSVVYSIIQKFKRRADFGKKKYNTDLDRNDLSLRDWYNHLHEELFDSILYLEKIMQEIDKISQNERT